MKYQRLAAICCAAVMVFTVISSGIAMAGEESFDAASAGYVVRPSGDTFMDQDFAVVNTDAGALRGYMENGVYTYLGIQYAQAGRFEVPRPVDSWEGVKNCFDYGPVSPSTPVHDVEVSQFFKGRALGMRFENEECHYLNVWSPTLDPDAKKAVMVYLHGGGFSTGSGADSEMEEMASMSQFGDVVCVSVNHRLNCLGFMDVSDYGEEYKYSGNNGMADIIAALQWVQNNITEFGGDPDNVTIFGQSGGGGKVMTLMGMPSAQGLFHKAIVQSGGAWANTQEDSRKLTAAVMEELGISTVEELKAVDYETLDAACNKMMAELNAAGEISMNFWSPTVDGDLYPELVGTAGGFAEIAKDIPLIIGTTFGEEMSSNGVPLVYNFGPGMYLPEYTEEDVMDQLEMRYSDNAQTIADCFRTAYPGHPLVEVLFLEQRAWSVEEAEKSFSDFIDSNLLAMAKADQNGAPVYSYVFAYTFPAFGGITAPHGAELDFLFHNIEKMKRLTNGEEAAYHLQDQVCRAWTNFAKTGDPSQDGLEWEPFTRENGATMIFDAESEVRCFHDKELMEAIIFAPASSGEEASDQAEVAE